MSGSVRASAGLGPAAPSRSRGARPRYVTPTRPHARARGSSEERCTGSPSLPAGGPPRGRGMWPRAAGGAGRARQALFKGVAAPPLGEPGPLRGEGRRAPSPPASPSQRHRLLDPLTGRAGLRWPPHSRSGLGVGGLSREPRGPYALVGKADKVGSRHWLRRPLADPAGGHVAHYFPIYFYGLSNLTPRDEADTPKSCPVAPLQTQK